MTEKNYTNNIDEDLIEDRTPRSAKSRSSQERVKVWKNPSLLETPEAPEGIRYYWVRDEVLGEADDKNVISRQRQGYTPVLADELPDGYMFTTEEHRKLEGSIVRSGDLILMKIPEELAQQRESYFHNKTRQLDRSIDAELNRHNSSEMPIHNDSRSTSSRGNPNFQDD